MMLLAVATAASLLTRMAAVNANLRTFTATLRAHVAMRSFPFLSADLVGTYYYEAPDKNKVAFSSGVPLIAQQFDKLYAHIESPAAWHDRYVVTLVSDDGRTAQLKLVPRKHGNIDSIDTTADDKDATVTSMRWNYGNGGYAEMTNHYELVRGNFLVISQTGHVEEPGYVADLSSSIDYYALNATLPQGVFEGAP